MSELLNAALKYADNGWRVFPLHTIVNGACSCGLKCSSPGKHPRTKNGLSDATTDYDVIEKWWTDQPDSNIGIATGKESDLWVLDVDNKKSVEVGYRTMGMGDHSVRVLEDEHEAISETRSVATGGGGKHYYFTFRDGCAGNRAGFREGLDIRGEGGYVVAPPSVHASGYLYSWEDASLLPGVAPGWLVEAANNPTSADLPTVDEQIPEGKRNQTLHNLIAKYRRDHGYNEWQLLGLARAHNSNQCVPPLPDQDVRNIARSCSKYEYVAPLDLSQWGDSSNLSIPEGGDLAISLFDLIMNPPEPPKPLVHDLISSGTGVLYAGQPNVGKSWLAMDLMVAVASGRPWLDNFNTEQGGVLMLDEEGTLYGQYKRFLMLLNGHGNLPAAGLPAHAAIGSGIRLDDPVGVTRVRRMLERYQPRLCVLDSLVRFHDGEENSAKSMANFFKITKDLMRTYDCTFLFTHHVRKPSMESIDPGDLIRGSTEIRAWPDTILVALPGDDQQEVVIHHIKARWSERLPPFKVRMQIDSETEKATLVYTGDVEPDDRTSAGSQNRILRAIVGLWEAGEDTDAEALSAIVGRSPRTVREHLKVMVGVGAVDAIEKHEPGKRPKLIYRIKGA